MKLLLLDWIRCQGYDGTDQTGEKEGEETKVEIVEPVHRGLHKLRPEQKLSSKATDWC